MLKLYKKEGETLRYWEAWVNEDTLTVHWGVVGEQGEEKQQPLPADEDPDMVLAQAAEPLVDAGYDEPEPDMLTPLVIQYPLQGKGTGQDFSKRNDVEELVTGILGWTGNGEVEGAETQPGRMNVFCWVLVPDIAVRTLVQALDEDELLEDAVIAVVREDEPPRVLWPRDYAGPFRV